MYLLSSSGPLTLTYRMPVAASAAETACVFPQPGGPYSNTPVRSRSGALPLSVSCGARGDVRPDAMRSTQDSMPIYGRHLSQCQVQGCGRQHTFVKQGRWLQWQAMPSSLWPASAAPQAGPGAGRTARRGGQSAWAAPAPRAARPPRPAGRPRRPSRAGPPRRRRPRASRPSWPPVQSRPARPPDRPR
jgi:hypothetical protein